MELLESKTLIIVLAVLCLLFMALIYKVTNYISDQVNKTSKAAYYVNEKGKLFTRVDATQFCRLGVLVAILLQVTRDSVNIKRWETILETLNTTTAHGIPSFKYTHDYLMSVLSDRLDKEELDIYDQLLNELDNRVNVEVVKAGLRPPPYVRSETYKEWIRDALNSIR